MSGSKYSDDVDFLDLDEEPLKALFPVCKDVLQDWNLYVNESKTEFVRFYVAGSEETDDNGFAVRGNEPWRFCKSLGSLLCSTADIDRRIILASSAFQTFRKVWLKGTKISLKRKLLVYEAQVLSVLLYNCSSWSAPKQVMEKLNVCHRKHLRVICNISYPGIISNKELYRRCEARPITERVQKARWTLLGHILRMDDNSPPYLSLRYAIEQAFCLKGRIGRPRSNLLDFIKSDLSVHNLILNNIDDLMFIRNIAFDRPRWRSMSVV